MTIHLHTTPAPAQATIWPVLKGQPLPAVAHLAQADFKGDLHETLLLYTADGHKHWLLGLVLL